MVNTTDNEQEQGVTGPRSCVVLVYRVSTLGLDLGKNLIPNLVTSQPQITFKKLGSIFFVRQNSIALAILFFFQKMLLIK